MSGSESAGTPNSGDSGTIPNSGERDGVSLPPISLVDLEREEARKVAELKAQLQAEKREG